MAQKSSLTKRRNFLASVLCLSALKWTGASLPSFESRVAKLFNIPKAFLDVRKNGKITTEDQIFLEYREWQMEEVRKHCRLPES